MTNPVEMRLCPRCAEALRTPRDKQGRALRFVQRVEERPPKQCRCALNWEEGEWPLYKVMANPWTGQSETRRYAPHTAAGRRERSERRAR